MATPPSFFKKRLAAVKAVAEPNKISKTLVDVGGEGDCGFRALAAAFIDNVLTHRYINPQAIKKLLDEHEQRYPAHQYHGLALPTPRDRMLELINHVPMSVLIPTMGDTLRQMAVDKMCEKPAVYRGAFVDEREQTSPSAMRKMGTWIDESSIAAVAEVLNMPVNVQVIEHGKPLRARLCYNASTEHPVTHPEITIQLEAAHYKPRVVLAERFVGTSSSLRLPPPVVDPNLTDPSLESILVEIKKEDRRLSDAFESTKNLLTSMLSNGELNKDQLLALYVHNMDSSDYLTGRVCEVGVEHGTQDFMNAIHVAQGKTSASPLSSGGADAQIVHELIHAIARAVSIGHMDADKMFEQIEEQQHTSSHRI